MTCTTLLLHLQHPWTRDATGAEQCPFHDPVLIEGYPGVYFDYDLAAGILTGFDDLERVATLYDLEPPAPEPQGQIEVRAYTEEENARADAIQAEATQRQAQLDYERAVGLNAAPDELKALQEANQAASGIEPGDPWRQPTGAHDSYPLGSIVSHVGKTWESLVPANVWIPGAPGSETLWLDTTPIPEGEWDPNGHAYSVGDEVTYEDIEYVCIQAHTSQPAWTPPATPALWSVA